MYGQEIASIRVSRGLSQESLAKMIGKSQNAISDIESDKRKQKLNEEELQSIAKALGVSVSDILSPTPIVMNFTTHDTATAVGQQNNSFDSKIVDVLLSQLSKKDEQIDKLLKAMQTPK